MRFTRKHVSSHTTRKSAREKIANLSGESSPAWFEIEVSEDNPHRPFKVIRFTPQPN
jgi:hypothetical protein